MTGTTELMTDGNGHITVKFEKQPNIYATVICDSISPLGVRILTMEVQCHRFVLAEFNTHRKFSRNSASSRAIPYRKQEERARFNPAIPLTFPEEQPGMQGSPVEAMGTFNGLDAQATWLQARDEALRAANSLNAIGVHKSVVNRIIEPFMWHRIIVTSTEWENFFKQRCSPLAQPEIRAVAECMQVASLVSVPKRIGIGEWHLPYITSEDWEAVRKDLIKDINNLGKSMYPIIRKISAARCARVSYLTHDGKRDYHKDIELYDGTPERTGLVTASPPHWSPLEHVATPSELFPDNRLTGNFDGWQQLRCLVEHNALDD